MSVKNDIEAGDGVSTANKSNQITSSGIKYSIILGIFIVINHQLAYFLHKKPEHDKSLQLSKTDAFIITAIMGLVNAMFYLTQNDSLWSLNHQQHLLILINSSINYISFPLQLMANWLVGPTICVLFNSVTLITSAIIDKFFFKKKWFCIDYTSIMIVLSGMGAMIISEQGSKDTTKNRTRLMGIILIIVSRIFAALKHSLAEYICKVYYQNSNSNMNKSEDNVMKTELFVGVRGIYTLCLSSIILPILSVLPGIGPFTADNSRMISIMGFISKLAATKVLILILLSNCLCTAIMIYFTNKVIVNVSAVAKLMVLLISGIPLWILNVFVFKSKEFSPSQWNHYFIFIAFGLLVIGVSMYYEVLVPSKWKRTKIQAPPSELANASSASTNQI